MAEVSLRKRVWGWFFFDWASQPYNTLLLTFIFAPYIGELLGDGSQAQAAWGYGVGITGVIIALCAPLLGAIADQSGKRMPFVRLFSVFYVVGAGLLWFSEPGNFSLIFLLLAFGLDPAAREGTRIVGPLTAVWYAVFMVPFFLWVRVTPRPGIPIRRAIGRAIPELRASLRRLTEAGPSPLAFLISSMFYRDALNGIYVFGGIYAKGVLGWSLTQIGLFGILGTITGATFAWLGGKADDRFGPKAVITLCVVVLTLVTIGIILITRSSVLGFAVAPESRLPDIAFLILGGLIGAAGGALQSASRTMMVRQASPGHMTEAFGLYALTGKATAFIAPLSIGIATGLSGNQQVGIAPLILLFLAGLFLLLWVKPEGERRQP